MLKHEVFYFYKLVEPDGRVKIIRFYLNMIIFLQGLFWFDQNPNQISSRLPAEISQIPDPEEWSKSYKLFLRPFHQRKCISLQGLSRGNKIILSYPSSNCSKTYNFILCLYYETSETVLTMTISRQEHPHSQLYSWGN